MSGFQAFLPVDSSLSKLKIIAHKLKPIQSGGSSSSGSINDHHHQLKQGKDATVKLFSPKEQVVEQAKDNLKRNREEAVIEAPDGIKIIGVKKTSKTSPSPKKPKAEPKPKPKSTRKSTKVHKKYGKKE